MLIVEQNLLFGEFALKATEAGRINSRQIEAARIALTRFVKRQGKLGLEFFQISL